MDFDPRDIDSRQHERNGLDRDSDPREVFTRDLDLPGGLEREIVRDRDREYTLRGSESRTLATAPRVAIERIMRLDAVLTGPDLDWLTTRREKARFVFAADGTEAAEGVPVSSETVALTARAVAGRQLSNRHRFIRSGRPALRRDRALDGRLPAVPAGPRGADATAACVDASARVRAAERPVVK